MIKILLLISIIISNIGVFAGPVALGLCCSSTCLLTGPLYLQCVMTCITSGGIVCIPPFMCIGAAGAPL